MKMDIINCILKMQLDVFGKCGVAFLLRTESKLHFNQGAHDQDDEFASFCSIVCSILSSEISIYITVCFENFTNVDQEIRQNYFDNKKLLKQLYLNASN